MQVRTFLNLIIVLAGTLMTAAAYAQTDPAAIERTIPKFEAPPPESQPGIRAPALSSQTEIQVAQTFVLSAVNIEGATVFESDQLAQSFEPYLASRVGQAELDKIASDITQRYRQAGFLLSYAVLPKQSVQSGIVHIRVVEGFVGNVRLAGDRQSTRAVRGIFERLTAERPLRSITLERMIGLARDVPGITVTDVRISRSDRDPAHHQLTITVGKARYSALAYSDNRGTVQGARIRGYSSFNIASLAVPGDQIQVDLFTIPYEKFRYAYGQVKGSIPLNSDGLRISASVSYGDQRQRFSRPHHDGMSRQFTGDLAYPFVRSRAFSLVGHASLSDWKSELKRAGGTVQRDRIQVARAWIEFARHTNIRIDGRIGVSRGLDLGSATGKDDPLASRRRASSQFTKFNAAMQVIAPLSDRVRARVDTSAQYSTKSLLASEEYAVGGSRIGRAFDFNELTGDDGAGGMLELAFKLGDNNHEPKAMEIFAYVDGGAASRKHASPGLPKDQWLAGAGAGARFSALGFLWSGEVGIPIARSGAHRDVRAFFSVARIF